MPNILYRSDAVCRNCDTQHIKNDHRGQIRKRGVWFENGPISHVTIQNHLHFGASLNPVNHEPEPQWPEHRGNCQRSSPDAVWLNGSSQFVKTWWKTCGGSELYGDSQGDERAAHLLTEPTPELGEFLSESLSGRNRKPTLFYQLFYYEKKMEEMELAVYGQQIQY